MRRRSARRVRGRYADDLEFVADSCRRSILKLPNDERKQCVALLAKTFNLKGSV